MLFNSSEKGEIQQQPQPQMPTLPVYVPSRNIYALSIPSLSACLEIQLSNEAEPIILKLKRNIIGYFCLQVRNLIIKTPLLTSSQFILCTDIPHIPKLYNAFELKTNFDFDPMLKVAQQESFLCHHIP